MRLLTRRQQNGAPRLTACLPLILRVSVCTVSVLMIFKELSFEIGPILASAGILGLAVGIGAQNLVKDVITGAFIVLEQQFGVGDVVRIGDRSAPSNMSEYGQRFCATRKELLTL